MKPDPYQEWLQLRILQGEQRTALTSEPPLDKGYHLGATQAYAAALRQYERFLETGGVL